MAFAHRLARITVYVRLIIRSAHYDCGTELSPFRITLDRLGRAQPLPVLNPALPYTFFYAVRRSNPR